MGVFQIVQMAPNRAKHQLKLHVCLSMYDLLVKPGFKRLTLAIQSILNTCLVVFLSEFMSLLLCHFFKAENLSSEIQYEVLSLLF